MSALTTFGDEAGALDLMRTRNRAIHAANPRRPEWFVVVDGPEDREWTVMSLRDAVDGEFMYRWER